jgi:hypothetical protein
MAYITTEEVRAIRTKLKETFAKRGFKFSVRGSDHMKVTVTIKSGKTDFSDTWDNKTPDEYGYGHCQLNHYYPEKYNQHADLIREIEKVIKTAPASATNGRQWYDDSDVQTDYFDTAFYFSIQVGQWDRPYIQQ